MSVRITALGMNFYSSEPSGSFSYSFDGGYASLNLDKEDCEQIQSILYAAVERSKPKMMETLNNIKAPELIGYDRTIENEIKEVSWSSSDPNNNPSF